MKPRFVLGLLSILLATSTALGADTFRFRLPTDPSTLDWTKASTSFETYVIMNIMEGLVEIDSHLQPVAALADTWEVAKDGLTYTFHLRPGVKWSDGVALTAKDFIFSWKRLLAPGTKNDYANFLFDVEHAEDFHKGRLKDFAKVGVKALDGERLQIRLRRPVPYFVTLLSFWVTFPQREDLVTKKGWDLPPKIVTLGPYQVTRWQKGKEIDFDRNPHYYGAKPRVEHVQALIEPGNDAARKLFFDGKIDALLNVTAEDLVDFTPDSGKQLRQFDYLATVFLAFNAQSKPTSNTELRRAIAQGLDRTGIQAALKGGQISADSLIPRGIAGYEPMSMPISTEQAKLALGAAGYKSAAEVPPLSLLCIEGRLAPAAEYVRTQVRQSLDLKIDLKCVSPAEYAKLRKAGKFQMVVAQWGADYPDASSFMEIFLGDAESNYAGWHNPRYDRLVNAAGGMLTVLERLKTYSEAQRVLLQDDAIVIPLYYPKITALLGAAVSEFEVNPLNYLFFKRIGLK